MSAKPAKLHTSLVARITIIALISAAVVFFGLVFIILLLRITTGPFASTPWLQPTLFVVAAVAILLGIPLLIGWLASRLIAKPLKEFATAIMSLRTSNYRVQLPPADIAEFEQVFAGFNELTKQLHTEEKLRKDLISDTSHELNTPLAAITSQLIAMQEGALPITKKRIGIVKEQTDRLTELVNGLDTYTRARTPNSDAPEPVHLKQLCEELIEALVLKLKEEHMTTELHISDELTIQTDPKALQQILQNLLQNALRYSEATAISITADEHGIRFSDNGKGVPEENLPYLFERFYRVEQSRNRATGGLGLGLAIVKELVECQGWTIEATLGSPGLCFVITF